MCGFDILFCFRKFFVFTSFECLYGMQQWLSPFRHLARNFMEFQKKTDRSKEGGNRTKSNRSEREKTTDCWWLGLKSKYYIKWISSERAQMCFGHVCVTVCWSLMTIADANRALCHLSLSLSRSAILSLAASNQLPVACNNRSTLSLLCYFFVFSSRLIKSPMGFV